jgi:predicted ester cyclase
VESNEKTVREAYRLAEGDILDGAGFLALFTEDGTFNDMATLRTLRGEQIAQAIGGFAGIFPDVHRELLAVHVLGDVIAVELRIQGTHKGPFPAPDGEIPASGNRIDFPAADFWYLRDGKIEKFVCYNQMTVLLDQITAKA